MKPLSPCFEGLDMKLILESSAEGFVKLRCEGHINGTLGGDNPLEEILGMGCYSCKVLLNLERATSITSTGVAWLVRCHKNFDRSGGMLVLHTVPPTIDHVLRLLNMHTLLHVADDDKQALSLATGKTS
jgi:anti-anti-sigma factor